MPNEIAVIVSNPLLTRNTRSGFPLSMSTRVIDRVFPFRGLPAPVYILFVARIINRMGDFVRYFLTLYLTRILGFAPGRAGFVVTAAAVAGMAGGLFAGRLVDGMGRKRVMLSAQVLSAAILIACGFEPNAVWLPYALVASQFFFGAVRPASQAMVTDLTPAADRRKAFGLLYLGINIGVSLGPMIAGFLFESHRRWIFWGDAATTLAGVVLVALLVPEPRSDEVHRGDHREDEDTSGALRAFIKRPLLLSFVVLMMLANFIYAQTHFALPLLLDHIFAASGARNFGILMSVNAVTVLLFTPVFLGILKQDRPARNLIWGAAAYAVGFGCLAFVPGLLGWILASTIIWTWGEVIFATNVRVFSAAYTPMNHRGRFASIEQVSWGVGAVLSPAVAGLLTQAMGARGVWLPIFALSIVLMAGMAAIDGADFRTRRRHELSCE